MRRALLGMAFLAVAVVTVIAPAAVEARRPVGRAAAAKKTHAASPAPKRARGGDKAPSAKPAPSTAAASEGDGNTGGAADTTTTTTTGGKTLKTKTYTFGALDVEGKLKTPQLLYFLDRVKLELEMSAPDKRSFMKELEKSADDNSL